MLPLKNMRISQEYGVINPKRKYAKGYHPGLDGVADGKDKGVYDIGTGVILLARFAPGRGGANPPGWGNYVIVRQEDAHDVLYAHLAQVAVTQGQRVRPGDKLGLQGATGNVSAAHLHLEIWRGSWTDRNDINPADYLGIDNKPGEVRYLSEMRKAVNILQQNGVINSPDYWLSNAVIGKQVSGEYAAALIINMAKKF